MSIQIAVRLPDEIVAFIDDAISRGDAPSRAAVVLRALERERRRMLAERDAIILAAAASADASDDDFDSLAAHLSTTAIDID